jgi:hypothetical protein
MSQQIAPVEAEFTLLERHLNDFKRRASVRYRCNLATLGKLFFPASSESLESWVHNLSETGVGLNLGRALNVGTDLVIRLRGPSLEKSLQLAARVIHATQEVDGTWRVGCAFETRLSADDLDSLL